MAAMLIDPLRLTIALVPLAAYLAVVGLLNLCRRPFMTTGACDLAALGGALTGFAVIGPMELFMPQAAAIRFGNSIWLFLLVFYWLCVSLAILLSRPRIVIYNLTVEELRPVLSDVVARLDQDARWAGDALTLPAIGVQIHLDLFPIMRHMSLVSSGSRQDLQGWRRLETELASRLKTACVKQNPRAIGLLGIALLMVACTLVHLLNNPLALAQAMQEMLL